MPFSYKVTEETTIDEVPVSLLIESPTGRRVAICIVYERLGRDAWWERYHVLERAGIPSAWVFGLRPMYFRAPQETPLQRDHAVAADRARGDVILEAPVFNEMRTWDCWPLLLSVETRQLANVIWPYREPARARLIARPACTERVALIAVSDLTDARLCRHGVAKPVVGKGLLAAAYAPARRPAEPVSAPLAAPSRPQPAPVRQPRMPSAPAAPAQSGDELLPGPGEVTTFGALLRGWPVAGTTLSPAQLEDALKSHLYQLRVSGRVRFTGPVIEQTPIGGPK